MFRRKSFASGVVLKAAKNLAVVLCLMSVCAFAAPKSASAYYGDAAFQYIENRLPSAEITCNEGLQYYPNDQKLQMLLDRIKEAKEEQKNENQKKDPKNDQNDDQNKDQDQNQEQNQDQNPGESSSSQGDDQQNQNGGGQSSSSNGAESSSSEGGAGEQNQPQQPEEQSSDSQGEQPEMPPEVPEGQMNPADAAQLLKDFDEQNGERKPWKPVRGQARPAKDW
ncbi:MAG: hypothetical protein HUK19_08985 [Fibrobacter sp.]|nr:hypothetical protein [Fibrobacter sp.]